MRTLRSSSDCQACSKNGNPAPPPPPWTLLAPPDCCWTTTARNAPSNLLTTLRNAGTLTPALLTSRRPVACVSIVTSSSCNHVKYWCISRWSTSRSELGRYPFAMSFGGVLDFSFLVAFIFLFLSSDVTSSVFLFPPPCCFAAASPKFALTCNFPWMSHSTTGMACGYLATQC